MGEVACHWRDQSPSGVRKESTLEKLKAGFHSLSRIGGDPSGGSAYRLPD